MDGHLSEPLHYYTRAGRAKFWKIGGKGEEPHTELNQKLLPTRWNKDVVGALRLDLPIDIENTTDDESDGKSRTSKCDFDSEMEEYDSESESSSGIK
jgi:hypothetical protein